MSINILYRGPRDRGQRWQALFASTLPEANWENWPEVIDPLKVDVLIAWKLPRNYQTDYPNLQVIYSVGAGVDQFDLANIPEYVQVVRMLDPTITQMMTEYILMAALTIHRDTIAYRNLQNKAQWLALPACTTAQRTVGIMGMGNLGQAAAQCLKSNGFNLLGWSRTAKAIEAMDCFHGREQLEPFLSQTDILICLLPLTELTKGLLNRDILSLLPPNASVINVGRGEQLVVDDLLALLDNGHLNYAVLDVFEQEPLEEQHPLWRHPKVLITPHIAAVTQTQSAGETLLANMKQYANQQPMTGVVDRQRGY
ncbi:glyoxylate/hydroxypyruvate reductase A [Aliiglaciecola sp. LCG003]|uniref:2-hydroxyacid dehydrogenase n=1 Tax=Aliiglaciecola sp. LCG003 TaxID=3053655 RepID=UPI002572F581|nr:glyoxylate/hydroxypyruvate reductase A [Aliiglaciecola sp. LCG003]WJG11016.1 glyoxylate/hydroxypyruvate reductase A [Aliiglaciecola sp. LCG003]